ncbi:MAG: hypothetical protein MET45_07650 [Nostoc sp. LLA-1]|nr:hypothetical protein [Cyanocohniella sp. LLY]
MFEPINLVDINNHWAQQCMTQLVSRQIVKECGFNKIQNLTPNPSPW